MTILRRKNAAHNAQPAAPDALRHLDAALAQWQAAATAPEGLEGRVLRRLRGAGEPEKLAAILPSATTLPSAMTSPSAMTLPSATTLPLRDMKRDLTRPLGRHAGRWALGAAAAGLACILGGHVLFAHLAASAARYQPPHPVALIPGSAPAGYAAPAAVPGRPAAGPEASPVAGPEASPVAGPEASPVASPGLATAAARRQPAHRIAVGRREGRASEGNRAPVH